MCGRYKLSRRKQLVEEYFDTASGDEDWNPRYNIAPTQPVAVIRQHPKEPVRQLSLMRWGLIPSWAKDSRFSNGAYQNLPCTPRIIQRIVLLIVNAEVRGDIRKAVAGLGEYRPSPSDDSGGIQPATGTPFEFVSLASASHRNAVKWRVADHYIVP